MSHTEIQDSLAGFALGALDADEQRQVATHLATGCAQCEAQLADWDRVVDALDLVAAPVVIPDLKPKLLQRLAPLPEPSHSSSARASWVPLALAASALLALATLREWSWRQQTTSQDAIVASLRTDLADSRDALRSVEGALAAKEQDATEIQASLAALRQSLTVLQSPGLQMVRLGQPSDGQASQGHLLVSPTTQRALFYAFDLAPIPAARTYELWWITKEGPINAGLFVPDSRGMGRVEGTMPAGVIQAAVTIEPAGGVDKPTGAIILAGKL